MATTQLHAHVSKSVAELEAMIEQDSRNPGRHNARMREYGTHIWAIIAALQGNDWDVGKVANDFHMPKVAIEAAVRYYEQNRSLIDAVLLLQHEEYISE